MTADAAFGLIAHAVIVVIGTAAVIAALVAFSRETGRIGRRRG